MRKEKRREKRSEFQKTEEKKQRRGRQDERENRLNGLELIHANLGCFFLLRIIGWMHGLSVPERESSLVEEEMIEYLPR